MKLPTDYNKLSRKERGLVRKEYIRLQKGKCIHCGGDLDRPPRPEVRSLKVDRSLFPPAFYDHPVHLHHNHDTGMTIGAVHAHCNAVLWYHHGE